MLYGFIINVLKILYPLFYWILVLHRNKKDIILDTTTANNKNL